MITKFIQYEKQVRGLSARTCQEYEKELRAFASWAKVEGLRWSTITKQDVDKHTAMMMEAGMMPTSIKKRVAAIRAIFTYFVNEGLMKTNPARFCSTPKVSEKLPEKADVAEIDSYLGSEATTDNEKEMHLAIAILLETGVRCSELLNISVEDIDKANNMIRVQGKGNKERIVFYGRRTAYELGKHLNVTNGKLFPFWNDATLRWEMIKQVSPFSPHCHPHKLRHTFACTMLNRGMDVKTLSVLMGHSTVQTTEIYAKMNANEIGARYNQFKF